MSHDKDVDIYVMRSVLRNPLVSNTHALYPLRYEQVISCLYLNESSAH